MTTAAPNGVPVELNVPPKTKVSAPNGKQTNGSAEEELKSKWPIAHDLAGSANPCRLEGEVADLVVRGEVPKELDGVFYRVMTDPWAAPHPKNAPIDGDGNISAFRFKDGVVDFKMRYIHTDRYKLERKAGKAMFGLYRNPFSHHPCVRSAVDSTANTNLVYWAGRFLALKEVGGPYQVDPITLETLGYDPYGDQLECRTFTAHPKVDPYRNELVTFGYEAKGLATRDVACWSIDAQGKVIDVKWLKQPWCGFIHDCVITEHYIVLMVWPFEATIERMKAGGHHWAYAYDKALTWIVVPRHGYVPEGWKEGETRYYPWKNCMPIHTGTAWEDEQGRIICDSSRVHDNAFPFFPPDDGRMPPEDTKADYVRWIIDVTKPEGTQLPDPEVLVDLPSEFPRVDERFLSRHTHITWLDCFIPSASDGKKNIFQGLNGLAMHDDRDGSVKYFYAGDNSLVQEPAFVPRSDDAPEGDGWIMALVERISKNISELVIIDTRDFTKAIAYVQLPFHVKAQIHGNYVSAQRLQAGERLGKFTTPVNNEVTKGKSALDFIQ